MVQPADVLIVLNVDTVGSTALRSTIGDQQMDLVEHRMLDVLTGAVEAHGGRVLRDMGDGISAGFASAAVALEAAAAVHRGVGMMARELGIAAPLQARIGAAVSDVTVSDVMSVGSDVRGQAPIEAARIGQLAPPGGTVCTEAVRLIARTRERFTFECIGQHRLKGLEEPVGVHRVVYALVETLEVPEALDKVQRFSFVGRRSALETLGAAWKAARAGEGGVAIVAGEPGIGKTRLCREHALAVHADGGVVLFGRCDEDVGRPFEPFVEAFRRLLAQVPRVVDLLPADAGELVRILPELADLIPDLHLHPVDPETRRFRLLDAMVNWVKNLCRQAPVLFVVDDVGWADESSLALLRLLMEEIAPLPLTIVATFRPGDASAGARRLVDDARRRFPEQSVHLSGLSEHEVVEFGLRVLGERARDQEEGLLARAGGRSAGNPLFLGELLVELWDRAGADTDAIGGSAGAARRTSPEISDLVRGRLARLSGAAQELVRVASVVGPSVSTELLVAILDLPAHEVAVAVEDAMEANVLQLAGDDGTLMFSHALVRDAVYETLSPVRRTAEHRRVAQAMERVYAHALDQWAKALAVQYERGLGAQDVTRAVEYYRRAARAAMAQTANEEAIELHRRAEGLLGASTSSGDQRLLCELQVERGSAERRAGHAASRRTFLDATELALQLGLPDLALRGVLGSGRGIFGVVGSIDEERIALLERTLAILPPGDEAGRARLLATLSAELAFDDDARRAERVSDEAMAIARRLGEPKTLVTAIGNRLVALWRADRVEERLHLGAEIDEIRRVAGHAHPGQFLVATTVYCQAAMEAGDIELADALLAWMRETAESLRQPTSVGFVKLRLASRACMNGDFAEAEELARDAYTLCKSAGQVDCDAFLCGQLVNLRFQQGRMDEEIARIVATERAFPGIPAFTGALACAAAESRDDELCREALARFSGRLDSLRFDLNWLTALGFASVGCAHLRDRALAERILTMLAPYRDQFVDNASTCIGLVAHYQGILLASLGDRCEAEAALRHALAEHRRVAAAPLVARSELELASVLLARGPGDRAAAEADQLLGSCARTARLLDLRAVARRASELRSSVAA